MNQVEKITSELEDLWRQTGYSIRKNISENVSLLAWRERKPIIPLGKWQDIWVVWLIGSEHLHKPQISKNKLRALVEGIFAPGFLSFLLKDPFINVVILGDAIDPDEETTYFLPDKTRHLRSTFYTSVALNVETRKMSLKKTWTNSQLAGPMLQAVTQVLMGKRTGQL